MGKVWAMVGIHRFRMRAKNHSASVNRLRSQRSFLEFAEQQRESEPPLRQPGIHHWENSVTTGSTVPPRGENTIGQRADLKGCVWLAV
ncbi:hypothetical protein TNCV_1019701 [Trichonephila clavipes]|nr:hypothetical protein TNCV_1019701 [Trichonephila clavipes]